MKEIERATYHFFDWLGDCGGLLDALFFLADMLIFPFTSFALRERLLSSLALYQASGAPEDKTKKKVKKGGLPENELLSELARDFSKTTRIPQQHYITHLFNKYCCQKSKKKRVMQKFQVKIEKELDLQKVLHRLRLFVFATAGILSKDQSIFADRMSQIVIRESSEDQDASSDDELNEKTARREVVVSAKRMMRSKDKVDARLINIFRLMTSRDQKRKHQVRIQHPTFVRKS